MNKKKLVYTLFLVVVAILANIVLVTRQNDYKNEQIEYNFTLSADSPLSLKVYYLTAGQELSDTNEGQSFTQTYTKAGSEQEISLRMPSDLSYIRIDPAESKGTVLRISDLTMTFHGKEVGVINLAKSNAIYSQQANIETTDGINEITCTGEDPFMVYVYNINDYLPAIKEAGSFSELLKKILFCVACDATILLLIVKGKQAMEIPRDVYRNRQLVWNLAKNDFKTRYAGSYLGIIWAFVQPVVTVLVYWFVFQKALNAASQSTKAGLAIPFVAWLVAGLVPWFYFQEVVGAGTNVLYEYSYLVKKVVFNISTLPVVKAVSALFVHFFFVAFGLILAICYHYYPSLYTLQLLYYSFGLMILCLGIIYLTSAAVVFFRDLSQIINIILQVLIWGTPIMWNYDGMNMNPVLKAAFKLNPLFYIVQGYRESLFDRVWFFEHAGLTVYFWIVTIFVFLLGTTVFRKLKVHYADVL